MQYATEIDQAKTSGVKFSICSLVTNLPEYEGMLASMQQAGFTPADCEFLYVNNAGQNKYDAYRGLNKLITQSKGDYIICCHQDVLFNKDNRNDLEKRLIEMDAFDPNWAVLGNAGGDNNLSRLCVRITDPYGDNRKQGTFPFKASSMDENFLLLKRSANLGFSNNLTGFHFYGTDICLIAETLGFNCYVIDFHLTHNSKGSLNQSFYDCKKSLIQKFQQAFKPRFIRTTCTRLYISGSHLRNGFFNQKKIISFVKRIHKSWLTGR